MRRRARADGRHSAAASRFRHRPRTPAQVTRLHALHLHFQVAVDVVRARSRCPSSLRAAEDPSGVIPHARNTRFILGAPSRSRHTDVQSSDPGIQQLRVVAAVPAARVLRSGTRSSTQAHAQSDARVTRALATGNRRTALHVPFNCQERAARPCLGCAADIAHQVHGGQPRPPSMNCRPSSTE